MASTGTISNRFKDAYEAYSKAWTAQVTNCTSKSAYSSSLKYQLDNCVDQKYKFIQEAKHEQIPRRVGRCFIKV